MIMKIGKKEDIIVTMENYKKLISLIEEYNKTKLWENIDGDDIFKIAGFNDEIYISMYG